MLRKTASFLYQRRPAVQPVKDVNLLRIPSVALINGEAIHRQRLTYLEQKLSTECGLLRYFIRETAAMPNGTTISTKTALHFVDPFISINWQIEMDARHILALRAHNAVKTIRIFIDPVMAPEYASLVKENRSAVTLFTVDAEGNMEKL